MRARRIAVVGAGIGGLTAALALLDRGFAVTVLEQATIFTDVGNGIQLAPNGTRALLALGKGEALFGDNPTKPSARWLRLWHTGDQIKAADLAAATERYGAPYLFVHRADLHAALVRAIDAIDPRAIRRGVRVIGVGQTEATASLELADGAVVIADAVIAADGVHSQVRQFLFGTDQPATTGHAVWREAVPMSTLPAALAEPIMTSWVGPGHHVVHYPIRGGTFLNVVAVADHKVERTDSWSTRASPYELIAEFGGWHSDLLDVLRAMKSPQHGGLLVRPDIPRWWSGRIGLIGDAVQTLLPFMAQGASMAIEDAITVARCLSVHAEVGDAFSTYEALRRERRTSVARASAENGMRSHSTHLRGDAANGYFQAEWRSSREEKRYDWIYSHDCFSEPIDRARRLKTEII